MCANAKRKMNIYIDEALAIVSIGLQSRANAVIHANVSQVFYIVIFSSQQKKFRFFFFRVHTA